MADNKLSERRASLAAKLQSVVDITCQPSFRDGGKYYKQYVGSASRDNDWPKTRIIDRIKLIEYGFVLIDLNYQQVLSRNDYCTPGEIPIASFDPDSAALAKRLIRMGHISSIEDRTQVPVVYREPSIKLAAQLASNRSWWGVAKLAEHVLAVDWKCERTLKKQDRGYVSWWLEKRGWKSQFGNKRKSEK